MGTYGVIDFDDEEIEAASHWYGGQGSMLYAITSTGALSRGTIRPRHHEGGLMTDEEWIIDLAERLESEAAAAARDAAKQAKKAKGAERKELLADREGLLGIAHKAGQFVRDAGRSKTSKASTTHHATRKSKLSVHHASKKTVAQLDHDIAQSVGKRIDRKKLGEMMHPWSGVGYGPDLTAIYGVASYYDSGKKYPDRAIVERAIKAIEADIPKAEHGAHGWTKADAKDLRTIAAGLRYYLLHDYNGNGTSHSTVKRDEELFPTAEARRQVQTLRHRGEFPEILAISMRADGINYQVKVPDPKNKRGYDLVDVLIHHNGARSTKSASRSVITPTKASKIVTRYLEATR